MKQFVLACLVVTLLTACPDPETGDEIIPSDPIEITQVQLSTLAEISSEEAKAMIDNVTSKNTICAHASADIAPSELKQLLSAKGVGGMKILRGNHAETERNEELKNRPTFILAVFVNKEVKYYKPLRVCPPPDGSTCLDGLNLSTNN